MCEPDAWGNGIGTNALRTFMNYYLESGVDEIYTLSTFHFRRIVI